MIIDNKGRLFGLINVIDLVALLLIIGVIGVVGVKILNGQNDFADIEGEAGKTIEVTLFIEKLRTENTAVISQTKSVYFNEASTKVEITKVDVTPMKLTGFNDKGEAVLTEDPVFKSVTITLKGEGYVNSETGEVFLEDEPVSVGLQGTLKDRFTAAGFVTNIKVLD